MNDSFSWVKKFCIFTSLQMFLLADFPGGKELGCKEERDLGVIALTSRNAIHPHAGSL